VCLSSPRHKDVWGVDVKLHEFLITTINGGEWSTSRSDHIYSSGQRPNYQLDTSLGRPMNWSERCGANRNVCRCSTDRGVGSMFRWFQLIQLYHTQTARTLSISHNLHTSGGPDRRHLSDVHVAGSGIQTLLICEGQYKKKQDTQCTYNLTLRRVRVTTVAVEKP
jgi:hypothetical protein